MTANEVHLIYFSPTHTSKQVGEAIVRGTGITNVINTNLTQQATQDLVIAGATFIGEHSYSTEKYPVAAGRPDERDLAVAADFGKQISDKIASATEPEKLYAVDVRKIRRPRQPFFPLFRFLRKVIALRKSGVPLPRTPWVEDESLCTHCGACAKMCPVSAIVKGDELNTDAERCIKCCACVKGCPQKARVYDTPFAVLLSQCFVKQKDPCTLV